MNIGNFNNYNNLSNINNTKTAKNNEKAGTANKDVNINNLNINSLINTATIGNDGDINFDTNKIFDNDVQNAPKSKNGKSFKDCFNKALKKRTESQGHTVTDSSNPKDGAGLQVVVASFVDALIDFFG